MSPRQFFILVISAVSLHQGSSYLRDPNLTDDVSKGKGGSLHSHIFKESIPARSSRTDLVNRSPLRDDHSHELVFVIRQNNMNLLARILNDISDPSNPSYGQHLSAEQISAITTNPDARNAIVAFLHTSGATISSESRSGDSINAIAPISIWENVLDTKFYNFHQRQRNGNIAQFVRAESYSIPRELDMHLAAVLRTVDIPVVRPGASIVPQDEAKHMGKVNGHLLALYDGITTAQNLRSYYSIGDATGSSASTQAAVAFSDNYFSPRSLAYFQRNMSFQPLQPALNFGGFISEDPSKFYLESNLDIEFIMAISPVSPTTIWHVAAGFETMMSELVSSNNPPYVISISYGTDESTYPANAHDFVTTLAIKLSAMGRTLVVASGDEGASSWKKCGYNPSFPASNPYFTAVGGTSGQEYGLPEVVCQAPKDRISSGGGFSTFYTRPSWQDASVLNYFKEMASSGKKPIPGYTVGGRGYPDISLAARLYEIRVPDAKNFLGQTASVSGTSAACPAVAGMISNINAARFAIGKGPVGWINPALYANSTLFSNDVTEGHNKCAIGTCCEHGYYATKGWDPTTGHGSVHYDRMADFFVKLGGLVVPEAPSSSPTLKPVTNTASPTKMPVTSTPSSSPTPKPVTMTASPTKMPVTSIPSSSPTPKPVTNTASRTKMPVTSTPSIPPVRDPVVPIPQTTSRPVSKRPKRQPTILPASRMPKRQPTFPPVSNPSIIVADDPSGAPTTVQTSQPSSSPSIEPTKPPTRRPRRRIEPTFKPTPDPEILVQSRMQLTETVVSHSNTSHKAYMLVASKIISDILGVSVTANELSAKPVERMASSSLLSLTFEVNATSEFTTTQTVSKLQSSIDGGSFANASLTTYGINVVSAMVNELADTDILKSPQPPASTPSASTSSSDIEFPSMHTSALAGVLAAGVVVFLALSATLYYYLIYKKLKHPRAQLDDIDAQDLPGVPGHSPDVLPFFDPLVERTSL